MEFKSCHGASTLSALLASVNSPGAARITLLADTSLAVHVMREFYLLRNRKIVKFVKAVSNAFSL
jgi:hypothetical protein